MNRENNFLYLDKQSLETYKYSSFHSSLGLNKNNILPRIRAEFFGKNLYTSIL